MNENLSKVLEGAVWARLDNHADAQILLLKGHLTLEKFMEIILLSRNYGNIKDASFHKKVMLISEILGDDTSGAYIGQALVRLNQIRNKFAHECQFTLDSSGIDSWENDVLLLFPVIKFQNIHTEQK